MSIRLKPYFSTISVRGGGIVVDQTQRFAPSVQDHSIIEERGNNTKTRRDG